MDPEFAAAFAAYQHDFACRALRYEFSDPMLEELPELTLSLIHDQVVRGYPEGGRCAAGGAARQRHR